jgi:hypothetical protein
MMVPRGASGAPNSPYIRLPERRLDRLLGAVMMLTSLAPGLGDGLLGASRTYLK